MTTRKVEGKVHIWAKWHIRPERIPVQEALSDQEYFYLSTPRWMLPGWDASQRPGYLQALNSPAPIHTPGRREALWSGSCFDQEHNTRSPQARARTRTVPSQGSNLNRLPLSRAHLPWSHCATQNCFYFSLVILFPAFISVYLPIKNVSVFFDKLLTCSLKFYTCSFLRLFTTDRLSIS